jgi:hypothetical protein
MVLPASGRVGHRPDISPLRELERNAARAREVTTFDGPPVEQEVGLARRKRAPTRFPGGSSVDPAGVRVTGLVDCDLAEPRIRRSGFATRQRRVARFRERLRMRA